MAVRILLLALLAACAAAQAPAATAPVGDLAATTKPAETTTTTVGATAPPKPPPPADATTTAAATTQPAVCGCVTLPVCPCRRELVEAQVVDCLCAGKPNCGCTNPTAAFVNGVQLQAAPGTSFVPAVNVAGSPNMQFIPASAGNPTVMPEGVTSLTHHVPAVNVPHLDPPSLVKVATGELYQPDHAASLTRSELAGDVTFPHVDDCACLNKPVCPCRPQGNLINPAPEYVTPKMKKMVNATLREHVQPEEKRPVTGLTVTKLRKNCCGPTGRLCRGLPPCGVQTPSVCECEQYVMTQVLQPSQCPCYSVPIDLLPNVAVVKGDVVRQDIVTPTP